LSQVSEVQWYTALNFGNTNAKNDLYPDVIRHKIDGIAGEGIVNQAPIEAYSW